jgi:hypothetical protein
MRQILAFASTALLVSVAMSTVVFAQKTTTNAARASRAEARGSLDASYNRCVSLAQSRGFTSSDIGGKNSPARNFVISCMQGKQR